MQVILALECHISRTVVFDVISGLIVKKLGETSRAYWIDP